MNLVFFDQGLTPSDAIILHNLADDIGRYQKQPRQKSNESMTALLEGKVGHVIGKLKAASPPAIPRERRSGHGRYSPDVTSARLFMGRCSRERCSRHSRSQSSQ